MARGNTHFDPGEPRDAEGQWTKTGAGIRRLVAESAGQHQELTARIAALPKGKKFGHKGATIDNIPSKGLRVRIKGESRHYSDPAEAARAVLTGSHTEGGQVRTASPAEWERLRLARETAAGKPNVGNQITAHHPVWGDVTGTVTAVHANGSIVATVHNAKGHTAEKVAFDKGEFQLATAGRGRQAGPSDLYTSGHIADSGRQKAKRKVGPSNSEILDELNRQMAALSPAELGTALQQHRITPEMYRQEIERRGATRRNPVGRMAGEVTNSVEYKPYEGPARAESIAKALRDIPTRSDGIDFGHNVRVTRGITRGFIIEKDGKKGRVTGAYETARQVASILEIREPTQQQLRDIITRGTGRQPAGGASRRKAAR